MVKSHTAAIEQLLEEFNDDQMMFRLEAEAYEQERLATMNNNALTTNHEPEPTTNTTEARQEGPTPVDTHITTEPTTTTTTVPDSEETADGPRRDSPPGLNNSTPIAPGLSSTTPVTGMTK